MDRSQPVPKLRTAGVLASELGQPLHRITYLLATRRIAPAAKAGRLRLFDRAALDKLAHELSLAEARRAKGVSRGK